MLKVMLVDDEELALDFFEILLNEIGIVKVLGKFTDPMKALERIDQWDLDAVFLDIDMPQLIGIEVAHMIKKKKPHVAIVFVTAYEQYAIPAFEQEALDYLLKPVDAERLKKTVNRIQVKRDRASEDNRKFLYEGFEVDYQNYEIRRNGLEIALSAKEKQLLMYMVANPNQVFSLDALYSEVWGSESNGDTRTVMVHISNLRKKIENNPLDPQMIKTVRGFGYMFEVNKGKTKDKQNKVILLEEEIKQLSMKAYLDSLTGIANRRYFSERMKEIWDSAHSRTLPISLILVDIDYFKQYNDWYGHLQGDECLKQVSHALQQEWKDTAILARFGGEEFIAVLPEINLSNAVSIAQQMRAAVESLKIEHKGCDGHPYLTISLGVACLIPDESKTPDDLVGLADRALYQAKLEGRNRVSAMN